MTGRRGQPFRDVSAVNRRQALQGSLAACVGAHGPLPGVFASAAVSPVATTKLGKMQGVVDRNILAFKGVPYGRDTSDRRFLPPLPAKSWSGVRDASAYGPACPQTGNEGPTSEDCLVLNVWTPALRDGARRPVMVYIHGGAYSHGSGSSPLYDGVRLCKRGDVVVVTVNHRLGPLGHLYLGKLARGPYASSGNVGLLDLLLALQWVQDNIGELGGDPARVMVFGQSGGGAKIATLLAMPGAKGLFHRAATMSGQQPTALAPLGATKRASAYLEGLGLKPEDWQKATSMPIAELVSATKTADPVAPNGGPLFFGPVVDWGVLPRHPFYPTAPEQSAGIPLILGNTHDETRSLIGRGDPSTFDLKWDEVAPRLARALYGRVDIDTDVVVAAYRKLYPNYTPSDVFFAATTAGRSWRGQIIEAESRAMSGSPAWTYQLDWSAPAAGGRFRAFHTLDIPLVFDNIAAPGSLTGTGADAQKMADLMSDAFIAHARNGDPQTPALPAWSKYSVQKRETMIFDLPARMENDPRSSERRLFEAVPYSQ